MTAVVIHFAKPVPAPEMYVPPIVLAGRGGGWRRESGISGLG